MFRFATVRKSRHGSRVASLAMSTIALVATTFAGRTDAGVIFVTSTEQKISATGGCSLQEAIAAANYDNNIAIAGYDSNNDALFIQTQCFRKGDVNDPNDLIVLPVKATFLMNRIIDDADNYMGPTATPMITSNITIDARGSTLQFVQEFERSFLHDFHKEALPRLFRAFAIDEGGQLELRSAHVVGFTVQGGTGGLVSDAAIGGFGSNEDGGGGGMGAGGAIYVHGGSLIVKSSTFEGNGAIGGDGAAKGSHGGGGGGGLGGWGGPGSCSFDIPGNGQGGGGGGARGFGIGSCTAFGGGTLRDATNFVAGFDCGGRSGDRDGDLDGGDGTCPGGGGGGGQTNSNRDGGGDGGDGAYGGGGGGGSNGGGGGKGGFGGGGGAGWEGLILGHTGGDGGFGGGGGAGDGDDPGQGGRYDGGSFYGGNGGSSGGGGGAGLGGAIFNHEGSVVVQNSTFSGNYVARGNGGNHGNGADAGGAIFTVNGSLVVQFTTIDGNEATGSDGGITVVQTSASRPTSFALHNTIITNNGAAECRVRGPSVSTEFLGNLIGDNVNCGDPITGDPKLGSLTNNQGLTPTKALRVGSPAINAADPLVFLGVDQRGQERVAGSADIGSFELCLTFLGDPCIILGGNQDVDFVKLTVAVSPAGSGTTTPAVGEHDVERNSVAALNATPNTSYRFVRWTGDVGDSASASTFIAMDEDKSVTANFELFDFNFSAVQALVIPVGGSGSTGVTVNSMGVFNEAVSLSTSGLPAGAFGSFNPSSVTPPAGQSASSQLTVNLAPWAAPGSYSFNVVGNGGGRQHSRAVSLTIAATAAGVTNVINTLLALGCIDNSGVASAFTTKLAQAQAAIDAGRTQTAINILSALLTQLQAQAGKHLATSCTSNGQVFNPVTVLITQVQSLLASLGATFRANPLTGSVLGTGGAEVNGAVVTLQNSSKTTVATAVTDATGFYFFADTAVLKRNGSYVMKVGAVPKPYKKSTPATQSFKWTAGAIGFKTFVLN